MKVLSTHSLLGAFIGTSLVLSGCRSPQENSNEQADWIVEASCGQCNFDLPGEGCDLAVRMKGKALFVDGSSLDAHGDAHASDGLCNAIRQAKVEGQIVADRFVATSLTLLPISAQ